MANMRIATWNINGLRARLDFLRLWLRDRRPDVVGLQELKLGDEIFPYAELEAEGYYTAVHSQKAWNGVAILSRVKPEIRQQGLIGQEQMGARLITASVGPLDFGTVYCPNGKHIGHPDFLLKLSWFECLTRFIREEYSGKDSFVLCGDFNLCPTLLDSWNEPLLKGQIFHTDDERTRFQELLCCGLFDVYRELNPDGKMFTWWDYRAGSFHKNQGLRIDLLLATRSLTSRIDRIEIDREYRKKKADLVPSDHAPVFADLRE